MADSQAVFSSYRPEMPPVTALSGNNQLLQRVGLILLSIAVSRTSEQAGQARAGS